MIIGRPGDCGVIGVLPCQLTRRMLTDNGKSPTELALASANCCPMARQLESPPENNTESCSLQSLCPLLSAPAISRQITSIMFGFSLGQASRSLTRILNTSTSAPTRTARAHSDYSVGWICALSKEQTAATAMLDHRHGKLPKPPQDPNAYTLGSLAGHNIVIACLPRGQIGTNSAATTATWMISTFPKLRFCLMVGIGGGNRNRNVKLGDVVVGVPVGRYPGVVQWDMGKATTGGRFERTGSLNSPPALLLTATTTLETEHDLDGSRILEYLDFVKERHPKLARRCERPSHPDEGQDIDVHYGLTASGSQVIKSSKFRDRLDEELEGNVLCFEMEAAGVMSTLPCLVIRGICDYADSRKNDTWQEHAAMVAAAYAKELLGHVQPEEVALLATVREVLRSG
jgi:nucleoside phosphorylase